MINKESIISAFTDRCTLLKWLKKVEAALKDSVLDDVAVNQISDTQIQLEFKFADGTSTLSPVLTLPKGDKGDPGEPGKDGLDGEGIAATVEVGTVTTGAPGSEASVTNSGTDQRAILNFVIPRGDPGSEGSAGVGFDDATLMEFNQSAEVILGTQGFTAEGYTKVTAGAEIFEIPSKMIIPVGGSESIIVDVNDTGTAIEIHLEAEILSKINRALLLPTSAPASISLAAVDTNNAQTFITLGDELEIVGGVLRLADKLRGTWVFNDVLSLDAAFSVNLDFTSNENDYIRMIIITTAAPSPSLQNTLCYSTSTSSAGTAVYAGGEWGNTSNKTIQINTLYADMEMVVGNAEAFLAWLQANATKQ